MAVLLATSFAFLKPNFARSLTPLFALQCNRAARLGVLSHASYGGAACLSRPTFVLGTFTLSFCLLLLVLLLTLVSSLAGLGDDLVPSRVAAPVDIL